MKQELVADAKEMSQKYNCTILSGDRSQKPSEQVLMIKVQDAEGHAAQTGLIWLNVRRLRDLIGAQDV